MQNASQIGTAASALAGQIRAGIPIAEAVERMAELQPSYADFWIDTAEEIEGGKALSSLLEDVWPDGLVQALRTGEESGRMADVLKQIEETLELQKEIKKTAKKIIQPAMMIVAGIALCFFFMLTVLPSMASSLKGAEGQPVIALSLAMKAFFDQYGNVVWPSIAGAIVLIVLWARTEAAFDLIYNLGLSIPFVRKAIVELAFGIWARYMSMMVSAGLETQRALELTQTVMRGALRGVIEDATDDLRANQPLPEIFDNRLHADEGPRAWVPFYIGTAFLVANQTGRIDVELDRVSPELIESGVKRLDGVIATLKYIAMGIAAAGIMTPMGSFYVALFGSISKMGS